MSNYYSSFLGSDLLTIEEERSLMEKIKEGSEKARKTFIEKNIGLVIDIATKYVPKCKKLTFDDLIQIGIIGLIKAVDKFNPSKGVRFSTYATRWIKASIRREIVDKDRTVRIPEYMYNNLYKYANIRKRLYEDLGRNPTYQEISEEMKLDVETIKLLEEVSKESISLNQTLKNDKNQEIEMRYCIDRKTPEDIVLDSLLTEELFKVINNSDLTEEETNYLYLKYILGKKQKKSIKELEKIFNRSERSLYRMEDRIFSKIRNNDSTKGFASYRDDPNRALDYLKEAKLKVYKR